MTVELFRMMYKQCRLFHSYRSSSNRIFRKKPSIDRLRSSGYHKIAESSRVQGGTWYLSAATRQSAARMEKDCS